MVQQTLPEREALDEDVSIERGRQARDFIESPAYRYMIELIERQIVGAKIDLIEMPRKDFEKFQERKIEILTLERLKTAAQTERNIGERTLERR